jgi:succinate-semialdehyde dehydrogenase/glutarate-semialdehyde dehydrogenase
MTDYALFIDGEWIAAGREMMARTNPATGAVIGHLPVATEADLGAALAAAARGFARWRATPAVERAGILHRAAALLRERAGTIAAAITAELGAPLAAARIEAMVAADVLDWSAGEARRIYGRVIPGRFPATTQIARRDPIGPVFAASPWNMPAIFPARKMAEALAAGCSVIIKPAEETPGAAILILRALHDAGLPADVVSMVFGRPDMISRRLMGSGVIRKLSFTGSVPVARLLASLATEHLVKCTLELGGHAPTIVFDDAAVEPTARLIAERKARNAGQVCNSPTRIYVQAGFLGPFREALTAAMAAVRVGDPLDPATQMGPLVNARRREAVGAIIDDARAIGARVLTGGGPFEGPGTFHALTLIDSLPETARLLRDEPFGPVAALQPFDTLDEVIERANALPFGLAAYAFTASRRRLDVLADRLEVGLLGLNHCDLAAAETPFGGMKDSGYGSEGGSEGIEGYLVTRFVTERAPPE